MSGDCPTGILVDLDSSRENSIQYRRSDILSLDGSSFFSPLGVSRTSFHECTTRDRSYDDSEMLENEKFDFDLPSDIMEDMSPEKSCKKRNLSTNEFSEITVRPPILSPPVFDPLEEIFQEARKIARRLSLPSSGHVKDNLTEFNSEVQQCDNENLPTDSTVQIFNNECETKIIVDAQLCTSPHGISSNVNAAQRKNTLKMNCGILKNTSPATAEHLVQVNANVRNMENAENDSRVANSSDKFATIPGSRKKTKEAAKQGQDFKKPLLEIEHVKRTNVKQGTPHKGKPLLRSETLKEKSATKARLESPASDKESPTGKAKLFRRRSMALTKTEVAEANIRPQNSPGCSTSSTPGKVSVPFHKGLLKATLSRPTTPGRLPPRVTFASQTKNTPAKESGGKTSADTKTTSPFAKRAAALISKIATPKKKAMLADMLVDTSICGTPSRIRVPSTLIATPKSSSKERVHSTTPLKIAPKFNCKM